MQKESVAQHKNASRELVEAPSDVQLGEVRKNAAAFVEMSEKWPDAKGSANAKVADICRAFTQADAARTDLLAALTLVRMSFPYSQFSTETKAIIEAALTKAGA